MTKIFELNIKNFRCINNLQQQFDNNFICFVGRGDSGKSTILDAISLLFSPNWNTTFYDTDFHNCNINDNIEIEATVTEFPEELQKEDKFGLHLRAIRTLDNSSKVVLDDFDVEGNDEQALTLKLIIDKTLEPKWFIINSAKEAISISGKDRAKFNVFSVADYIDKHFSWSKDNPLYRLLRKENDADTGECLSLMLDIMRKTKDSVDENGFNDLEGIHKAIVEQAKKLGLHLSELTTTIDLKDIILKEGKICLHDNKIPLRLKGKGSKRLLSTAIQTSLTNKEGILLIDEVEQGLEPDRIKHLVRELKSECKGQVFITTHSRDVVTEIDCSDISIVKKGIDKTEIIFIDKDLQNIIRMAPETIFSKKIIICEGKTEVGLCRAFDSYRKSKKQADLSYTGTVYICGEGSKHFEYCNKLLTLGYKLCCFCDNDIPEDKKDIENLVAKGIKFIICDENKCIEQQIYNDLLWKHKTYLIEKRIEERDLSSIKANYKQYNDIDFPDNWKNLEDNERTTFIENILNNICGKRKDKDKSRGMAWYKNITSGEDLGNYIFAIYNELSDTTTLVKNFNDLSNWIDNE